MTETLSRRTLELATTPARIVLVLVLAVVLRALLHRAIKRLVTGAAEGSVPVVLRPLHDRARGTLLEASPLSSQRRRQRAETIGSVLRSITSILVFGVAGAMVLAELGFDLGPVIASAGIVGVAVGFGAQNLIKDFLNGMFMILEDQYGVGDVIDLKDATGTVEAVGLRTTRLRDEGGTVWYMRNGEIVRVGNHSQGFAQVVLDVPIKPDGDVARAESVMRAVAASIAADPEWTELFLEDPRVLGIQSITLEATTIRLTARVRPLEQWRVARELRGRIRQSLDDAGTPAAAMPDPDPDPAMPAAPAAPPSPAALALSVDPAVAP